MNMFWEIKEVVAGEEHQCFAYRHIQDHHPYNNFSWFDKQAVRKFKRNGCRIKQSCTKRLQVLEAMNI